MKKVEKEILAFSRILRAASLGARRQQAGPGPSLPSPAPAPLPPCEGGAVLPLALLPGPRTVWHTHTEQQSLDCPGLATH